MSKKLTKSHTTFLDSKILEMILEYLENASTVKSYTAGIIKVKTPPSKTVGPVKIVLLDNHILLRINTKSANQEVRVYGNDLDKVKKGLQTLLKNEKIKFI